MTETEALMCINAVPGIGSIRIRRLMDRFHSAGKILEQRDSSSLCRAAGIGPVLAEQILNFDRCAFFESEKQLIKDFKVSIITLFDDFYPAYLKEISDPPIILYVLGNAEYLKNPGVAVVGCRRASFYGLSTARDFSRELARAGVSVISGMARGIDTAAHEACLQEGGITVAVLGSGLARLYPPENKNLAERISARGCVISEFPMTAGPAASHFPRRNRVISGLSTGIIVVEASARSGALITAQCALEQGRDVFAVPGKVGQPQARGTNALIQQGAKLVMSIDDVLDDVQPGWSAVHEEKQLSHWINELSEDEEKLFHALSDEPTHLDDLIAITRLDTNKMLGILLQWECNGRIQKLPGQYFVLNQKS